MNTKRTSLPALTLCLTILAALTAGGCHRAPRTSAELRAGLPGSYTGEIHLQGMPEVIRLRVTPHSLTDRDANTLEFNSVQYALLDPQGGVQSEGDASIRGTITLPDLAVKLESIGNLAGGEDLVKSGSFQGKLSDDLQSGEADWTTSLNQKGHLKVEASK